MAKLPDADSLGGLPTPRVPGRLPSADMSSVARGYTNLGSGLKELSNSIEAHFKEQNELQSVQQKADFSIGMDADYIQADIDADYENAPEKYKKSAYARLEAAKAGMKPEEAVKFDAAARMRIEDQYNRLYTKRNGLRHQAVIGENDKRLGDFASLGAKALDDPDNPNWGYYDEQKAAGLALIDAEAKQFKVTPKAHQKRRREFIEGMDASAIRSIAERDPEQAKAMLERFKAGPPEEEAPKGVFDRSSYRQELEINPALRERLQVIVQGEVGRNAPADKKMVALESIFNRAAARGQSLEQVTRMYTGPGSDGYYPATTFKNGAIRNDAERQSFESDFLEPVLNGSDRSTELLGFATTGNASQGVAARGIASGRYKQYGTLDGRPHGSPGVETWVAGHGNDDVTRLNSLRLPGEKVRVAEAGTGTTTDVSARSKSPSVMVSDTGMTIRPDVLRKLERDVDILARSKRLEADAARRAEAQARKDASEKVMSDYTSRWIKASAGDTTTTMPTLKEIATAVEKQEITDEQGRLAAAMISKPLSDSQRVAPRGAVYRSFYSRAHDLTGARPTENEIRQAAIDDRITFEEANELVTALRPEKGEATTAKRLRAQFFKDAEDRIRGPKELRGLDTRQENRIRKFMEVAEPLYDKLVADGKAPMEIHNQLDKILEDPKYLGTSAEKMLEGLADKSAAKPLSGPKAVPMTADDFKTAEEVKAAAQSRKIPREVAIDILVKKFGMTPPSAAPQAPVSR